MRTRVGYAGGTKDHPTYHDLGDHAETIEVDFDPERLSYEELLEIFWTSHSPTRPAWSRQYMSAIFHHGEEQKRLALATRERRSRQLSKEIHTEIAPAGKFYLAEDYHQKYMVRRVPELMAELEAMYPDNGDFVNSTAVARINGYLAGGGTTQALEAEIDGFGLSVGAQRILLKLRSRRG